MTRLNEKKSTLLGILVFLLLNELYAVDGTSEQVPFDGGFAPAISPDAKQEFCFLSFRLGREIALIQLDGVNEAGMSLSRDCHRLYFPKVEHRSRDLMIVENFWR